MSELLEALNKLQNVERQLSEFRRHEDGIQRRIAAHTRKLTQTQADHDQLRRELAAKQRRIDERALEVATREESAAKHREALNRTRTNKEYAAILTAINTEKADTSKIEMEIVSLKDEYRVHEEKALAAEMEKDQIAQRIAAAEQEMATYREKTRAQREKLLAERQAFSVDIPASAMQIFLRVAERHDGEAMAPVTKVNPRREEYACSGCNIRVSIEVVSALQGKGDLQYCKVCGRILYLAAAAGAGRK
jgi:predicted  nucleic acid-binding Zn-ribbon protein